MSDSCCAQPPLLVLSFGSHNSHLTDFSCCKPLWRPKYQPCKLTSPHSGTHRHRQQQLKPSTPLTLAPRAVLKLRTSVTSWYSWRSSSGNAFLWVLPSSLVSHAPPLPQHCRTGRAEAKAGWVDRASGTTSTGELARNAYLARSLVVEPRECNTSQQAQTERHVAAAQRQVAALNSDATQREAR